MDNNEITQTLQFLIGSRYVPAVRTYISELTGRPDVQGPGDATAYYGLPESMDKGRPDGLPGDSPEVSTAGLPGEIILKGKPDGLPGNSPEVSTAGLPGEIILKGRPDADGSRITVQVDSAERITGFAFA